MSEALYNKQLQLTVRRYRVRVAGAALPWCACDALTPFCTTAELRVRVEQATNYAGYAGQHNRVGFAVLAMLWLFSGLMAYKHIRNREIQRHRHWMVRNYTLTFAAVTLRLWQVVFQVAGVDFIVAYVTVAWLCWIPNLMAAEWMVSRMRSSQRPSTTVRSVG